jgi:hypothetical protein
VARGDPQGSLPARNSLFRSTSTLDPLRPYGSHMAISASTLLFIWYVIRPAGNTLRVWGSRPREFEKLSVSLTRDQLRPQTSHFGSCKILDISYTWQEDICGKCVDAPLGGSREKSTLSRGVSFSSTTF